VRRDVTALAGAAIILAAAGAAGQAPPDSSSSSSAQVTISGYIQPRLEITRSDGNTTDDVLLRRAVVAVRTTLTPDWSAAIQVDFAPALDEDGVTLLDGYLRYNGFAEGTVTITAGNQKVPFSRSALFSSQRRGLVERPFTGERGFAAPGRAIGLQVDGRHRDSQFQWSAALASVYHAPDVDEIRFDGLAEADETWNQGLMTVGRFEWHPFGAIAREQGDFEGGAFRLMTGGAAHAWRSDGDNNAFTEDGRSTSDEFADLDSADAVELNLGLRGHGISADVAWSWTSAELIDPTFGLGLYEQGKATLQQFSTEAGYMLLPARLEALAAIDSLSSPARPSIEHRSTAGMNWYANGHRLKISAMHRETFNARGATGARSRTTYIQAQLAF
jgi:phosphate-selective porin OprO and OprP